MIKPFLCASTLIFSTGAAWSDTCVLGARINGLYSDTILYQIGDHDGSGKKIKIGMTSKSKIKDLGFVRGCGKNYFSLMYRNKPVKARISDFDFSAKTPKKGFQPIGICTALGTQGALC